MVVGGESFFSFIHRAAESIKSYRKPAQNSEPVIPAGNRVRVSLAAYAATVVAAITGPGVAAIEAFISPVPALLYRE